MSHPADSEGWRLFYTLETRATVLDALHSGHNVQTSRRRELFLLETDGCMGRWIDNGWTDGHMDRWASRWMMEGQMNILADMDDGNGLMDG